MELVIVYKTYVPNSAGTNRLMSFVSALSKIGQKTKVVFFSPDVKFSKLSLSYPGITFEYLWDRHYIKRPQLKYLSFFWYFLSFTTKLKKGTKVLIFGFSELLNFITKRKDIDIYYEISECPEVSLTNSRYFSSSLLGFLKNCKKLTGVVVISSALKEYFVNHGVDANKIHIINMTVDPSRFTNLKKTSDERYIAYCGTASNNKDGVDQLIKAFALTSLKHPEYKLHIIGKTPDKNQAFENHQLVEELGISDKVVFTGIMPSVEIPQYLKNASILALDRPRNIQAKYGFPTKLGEYLLTENPVVITSVGDIPLFLTDRVSALIAEPESPESFSEKLNWAIENEQDSLTIGLNGAKVAKEEFNGEIETIKLLKALEIK